MTIRPEKRNFRILALNALVLLAFVFHSFLPAGFMPGQDSGGKASIVICTASGLKTIEADSGDSKHKTGAADHCPFAPVLTQGFAPAAPVLTHTAFNDFFAPAAFDDLLRFSFSSHLYDSQGPPLSS